MRSYFCLWSSTVRRMCNFTQMFWTVDCFILKCNLFYRENCRCCCLAAFLAPVNWPIIANIWAPFKGASVSITVCARVGGYYPNTRGKRHVPPPPSVYVGRSGETDQAHPMLALPFSCQQRAESTTSWHTSVSSTVTRTTQQQFDEQTLSAG